MRVSDASLSQLIADLKPKLLADKNIQLPLWVNEQIPEVLPFLIEDEQIIERMQADFVFAARLLFRFDPYPYQAKILTDMAPFVAIRQARQTGKSYSVAARLLLDIIFNVGYKILVVAPSMRQIGFFRDRIDTHINRMPPELRNVLFKRRGILRQKIETQLESAIYFVTNSPDLILGFTAHKVFADEANMLKNDFYLFDNILLPMLSSTNGSLWLASTPRGKSSVFYHACLGDNAAQFSQHHVTYTEGLAVGQLKLPIVQMMLKRYANDPAKMATEMLAEFYEDTDKFLTVDMLKNCIDPNADPINLYTDPVVVNADGTVTINLPSGNYYMGTDYGKLQDHSVVALFDEINNMLRLKHLKIFALNTPYEDVIKYVTLLDTHISTVMRSMHDQSNVGEYIMEKLTVALRSAEGVKFTLQRKISLGNLGKSIINTKQPQVSIPDDPDLINYLNIVGYEKMPNSDNIKFICPENEHDDVFWAFMLGIAAAREPSGGKIDIVRH